jgi:hypothetical protein
MSRYQRGHIYEAFGAFTFDSTQPSYVTDSSRACRACMSEVTPSLCQGSKALLGQVEARAGAVR